jgi:hypothetical protein
MLIVAFATAGALVYYATAPAAAPGQQGFSIGRILDHLRREVRGNRSSAEVSSTTAIPIRAGVTEVRFETGSAPLTISSEDRADMLCELQTWSSGYDETEAARRGNRARRAKLVPPGHRHPASGARDGAPLIVRIPNPSRSGPPSRGKIEIGDVASVELVEARGQATALRQRPGAVTTAAAPTIEDAALKLAHGERRRPKNIKGDAACRCKRRAAHGVARGRSTSSRMAHGLSSTT